MADVTTTRCGCAHCRVHGLMGPIMVITVGVIFLLHEFTRYSFGDLWPVLLIVAGVVLLGQSVASKAGHIAS